jgi:membrane associated rhomboid family serine protease
MPSTPAVYVLVAITIAMFLAQQIFGPTLLVWLALWPIGNHPVPGPDGSPVTLGFLPWQLLSYGFLHGGLFHLAFNLFGLYSFGSTLERYLGSAAFLRLYLGCVIGAGLTQLTVATAAVQDGNLYPTVGASGGVFGVVLAFAMLFPKAQVMLLIPPIPMPAWVMVILFVVIELTLGVTGTASGIAHFAHLGGMATGFLILQYWRGRLPIQPKRILRG